MDVGQCAELAERLGQRRRLRLARRAAESVCEERECAEARQTIGSTHRRAVEAVEVEGGAAVGERGVVAARAVEEALRQRDVVGRALVGGGQGVEEG